MYVGLNTELISPTTRLIIGTGVMGGFTIYSSFNYETIQFVQDRAVLLAAVYLEKVHVVRYGPGAAP
jgi:fluoride exporter